MPWQHNGQRHQSHDIESFSLEYNRSHTVTITTHIAVPYFMMTSSNGNIFRVTGPLCGEISPVPVNSLHKGQWRGALMFSLICVWISDWVNNREAGDLRRYRGHYHVSVMLWFGGAYMHQGTCNLCPNRASSRGRDMPVCNVNISSVERLRDGGLFNV